MVLSSKLHFITIKHYLMCVLWCDQAVICIPEQFLYHNMEETYVIY
uniref:Uncharacterized protein n=1 Tax=Arundo donax TaxID=35708 RepID=A0A0A9FVR1_ARUDO